MAQRGNQLGGKSSFVCSNKAKARLDSTTSTFHFLGIIIGTEQEECLTQDRSSENRLNQVNFNCVKPIKIVVIVVVVFVKKHQVQKCLVGFNIGLNLVFNIGFNIWFNIGLKIGFNIGINIGLNIGVTIGFKILIKIGFDIGFNIGLEYQVVYCG